MLEKQQFLGYYNRNFPGLITEELVLENDGKTKVIMNTKILYERVAPELGKVEVEVEQPQVGIKPTNNYTWAAREDYYEEKESDRGI